jgi:toxin ParE1/3/4
MSRIRRRRSVDDDILEITKYLLHESEELAVRFVDAVQKTLKNLAQRPGIGSPKTFDAQVLDGIRSWWVEGFPNHLIFYFPLPDGIEVVAVMHGARDVEKHLIRRM